MNHQQVQEWLAQIEVGQGMHHENLTVFSVFWRGPVDPVVPQKIYRMENENLGADSTLVIELGLLVDQRHVLIASGHPQATAALALDRGRQSVRQFVP